MVLFYFTFHSFYYFSIVPYIFIHRPSDIHLCLKSNYPGIHPYINYHQQKIEYLDHFFIHLNVHNSEERLRKAKQAFWLIAFNLFFYSCCLSYLHQINFSGPISFNSQWNFFSCLNRYSKIS